MKKFILLLIFLMTTSTVNAENMETERELFICALSSTAAYNDETGNLAKRFFESGGWKVNVFENPSEKINVKIHFMSNTNSEDNITRVFFITGTEDLKDIGIDAKIKPVPLNEDNENILVHRGFRDYADAALDEGIVDFFVEYIDNHPEEKIYITGHSLGGAVAMMVAVRLFDAGADMRNVKVITFGAPAVGNKNFVEKYRDKINLTRVVMDSDIIDVSLNIFGYTHFGNVINYKPAVSSTQYSHSVSLYLDNAIRNFYDAGLKMKNYKKLDIPVYIAPIQYVHKSFSAVDEKYAKEILRDGYSSRFTGATFDEPNFVEIKKANDFSYNVREYIDAAKKFGSKFIIVPMLHTKPVRDAKKREVRVLVEEIIFDNKGRLISMNTSGITSSEVTILGAEFFGQEILREDREKFISDGE